MKSSSPIPFLIVPVLLACLVPVPADRATAQPASENTAPPNRLSFPASADSGLAGILSAIEGSPLTLREAVGRALKNATRVGDAAYALDEARAIVRRERGGFDPEAYAEVDRTEEDQPTASAFAGADVLHTEESRYLAGLRIRLPLGTDLDASLQTTRRSSNSSFSTLDPEYDGTGRIELRQPLLQGFGPSAWKDLSAAKRRLLAAQALYDDAVLATATETERLYWDLYSAERDYAVQRLIRDQAEVFLQETNTRARTGLVGPGQVASARVFLAEQELVLLDRLESLDRVSDQLATLLGARPSDGSPRFRPIDEPPSLFPESNVEEMVALAIRESLPVQAAEERVAAYRALETGAWWDALPALDLVGSLGGSGLAGTGRDVIFGSDTLRTSIDGDANDALNDVLKRDYPTWSVGLRVSIPIGLRAGRGGKDQWKAVRHRAEQEKIAVQRMVEEQVRSSHRQLEHGKARLETAREGVTAAVEQVRIGLIDFRNGRSTAFELVRLGADLAAAQRRYSEAMVRTAKAAADLRRWTSGAYQGGTPY